MASTMWPLFRRSRAAAFRCMHVDMRASQLCKVLKVAARHSTEAANLSLTVEPAGPVPMRACMPQAVHAEVYASVLWLVEVCA